MPQKLQIKDILNKTFKSKMRGYDPIEVDEFLDTIMQDYEKFEKEIALLKKQLAARATVSASDNTVVSQPVNRVEQTNHTNYDILRRISNLEKHVFGAKLDAE